MRIIQLTDLHLRKHLPGSAAIARRQSRRVPALLREAVARMADLSPDLVVVSGDLLDFPLGERADPRFRSLGREDLALIAEALAPLSCATVVLPGNHDPADLCGQVFFPVPERRVGGYRVIVFYDDEDEDHVPHRRGGERRRFEQVLADGDPAPQVHIQHYVVWPRLDAGYPYTYAGAESLKERILASGRVRLVLSGHYHRGLTPFRQRETWFATAPALCEAPFGFWLYDLHPDRFAWQALRLEDDPCPA